MDAELTIIALLSIMTSSMERDNRVSIMMIEGIVGGVISGLIVALITKYYDDLFEFVGRLILTTIALLAVFGLIQLSIYADVYLNDWLEVTIKTVALICFLHIVITVFRYTTEDFASLSIRYFIFGLVLVFLLYDSVGVAFNF